MSEMLIYKGLAVIDLEEYEREFGNWLQKAEKEIEGGRWVLLLPFCLDTQHKWIEKMGCSIRTNNLKIYSNEVENGGVVFHDIEENVVYPEEIFVMVVSGIVILITSKAEMEEVFPQSRQKLFGVYS